MKRTLLSLILTLFAGTALADPVTVDNCGKPLTFEKPPERVVVFDIGNARMAFALELQSVIVGLAGITGWYSLTPEFTALQGSIPELAPKRASLENLIAVSPDMFFAGWYYGMDPGGEVTPDTLAPHGIKTLILTESCAQVDKSRPRASMDLLYTDMLRLGKIFHKEEKAETLVKGWKDRISAIEQKTKGLHRPRVFLYDSGEDKPFIAGKFAMPTALIDAAGGDNITADIDISWGTATWEAVAAKDPEVVILLDYQDGGGAEKSKAFLKAHPIMKEVQGVKNDRFMALRYEELVPGPDNVDAVEKIAHTLHPDKF